MTRILYASDWEGPTQVFAVDPTGRSPLGQVTFDHAPAYIDSPFACGFTEPRASPNGKAIVYAEVGSPSGGSTRGFWVADTSGRGAHEVASPPPWYDENSGVGGHYGGDRIYWGEKGYGLAYDWSLHARTISTGQSVDLANGFGYLGCPYCGGAGALAAAAT